MYDLEIFPNMFSGIFIDIGVYLKTFADCVNDKGKPIPLTEKLSVAEIEERLDSIPVKTFYITDTDDSQLLEWVAYINEMQAYYKTIEDSGVVTQEPIRYDMYGFNSLDYDDNLIRAFMMNFNRYDNSKALIKYLKKISDKLIDLQNDKDAFYNDKELEVIRNYRLPWATVDVQCVYGLKAASVIVDKDTKERIKVPKGLKNTSVNLKWHNVLDFTLPPIDEEEYDLYYRNSERFRGMNIDEVRKLLTNDFQRCVLPKYIPKMLHYNRNDVFLIGEMVRQNPDEVRLRYGLHKAFGINCLSSARSNISDKLLVKFYSQFSGLHKSQFEKKRTERTRISFNKVIFPHIKFKTKQMQDLLDDMMTVYIYHTTKADFTREFEFYGTKYSIGCGGIHTQDPPRILISNDKFIYVHWDYTSYYPSIMISYEVAPKHLNAKVFAKMVNYFKTTRVEAKHNKNKNGNVIEGVDDSLTAEALKIVINAIYGKLGSELFWLYDRLAQMKVTINGQLMTLSLIESLELEGIHCVSANTDGIIVKIPTDKLDKFKEITEAWNEHNKMSADGEYYKMLVNRDVNSYFDIQTNGDVEYKGDMDPLQYRKNYSKGYDMPIVAKAVYEYFVNNTPVMETLRNHKDILDFCKTQNVGSKFNVCYDKVVDGKITTVYCQRHFRFYVSQKGVIIQKEDSMTGKRSVLGGGLPSIMLNNLDDKPIEERGINYAYYFNEAMKFINPIKLGISTNQKGNSQHKTVSGRVLLKKRFGMYNDLFDNEDES